MRTLTGMKPESPLGKDSEYPREYAPEVLYAIPREGDRSLFSGMDIWNAWDLTWLGKNGQPQSCALEIRITAESTHIVESKSLKLYLGSLAMTQKADIDAVMDVIQRDLESCVGGAVDLRETEPGHAASIAELPGECLDKIATDCVDYHPNPDLLIASGDAVTETLFSHSLRSLCPVTSQPDIGSVMVTYTGPQIDRASLLKYIVSYREHNDFHEACVERMFLDIRERCQTEKLTVYARYQRRGGIDINPFRSDVESDPQNLRIWRQ